MHDVLQQHQPSRAQQAAQHHAGGGPRGGVGGDDHIRAAAGYEQRTPPQRPHGTDQPPQRGRQSGQHLIQPPRPAELGRIPGVCDHPGGSGAHQRCPTAVAAAFRQHRSYRGCGVLCRVAGGVVRPRRSAATLHLGGFGEGGECCGQSCYVVHLDRRLAWRLKLRKRPGVGHHRSRTPPESPPAAWRGLREVTGHPRGTTSTRRPNRSASLAATCSLKHTTRAARTQKCRNRTRCQAGRASVASCG